MEDTSLPKHSTRNNGELMSELSQDRGHVDRLEAVGGTNDKLEKGQL